MRWEVARRGRLCLWLPLLLSLEPLFWILVGSSPLGGVRFPLRWEVARRGRRYLWLPWGSSPLSGLDSLRLVGSSPCLGSIPLGLCVI